MGVWVWLYAKHSSLSTNSFYISNYGVQTCANQAQSIFVYFGEDGLSSSVVEIYIRMACGFCWRAKDLLDEEDIPYTEINLMKDRNIFDEMVERTGWRTVPQIIINGQPIGGFKELSELKASGELARLLVKGEEN